VSQVIAVSSPLPGLFVRAQRRNPADWQSLARDLHSDSVSCRLLERDPEMLASRSMRIGSNQDASDPACD